MAGRQGSYWAALVLGLGAAAGSAASADAAPRTAITAPAESEPAIRRALSLLPRRPAEVRVVDADQVDPEARERFLKAEAFFSKGRPAVCLTRHSPVLRAAQEGSLIHVHVLAAIIWHEMAHMDGADELEAQRREESMWRRFVRDGLVDQVTALRFLKRMVDRHRVAGESFSVRPSP